jgi:hypothetical protein
MQQFLCTRIWLYSHWKLSTLLVSSRQHQPTSELMARRIAFCAQHCVYSMAASPANGLAQLTDQCRAHVTFIAAETLCMHASRDTLMQLRGTAALAQYPQYLRHTVYLPHVSRGVRLVAPTATHR